MKIGFIGLGKLGLPVALAIESKGHDVFGIDIDPNVVETIKTKKLFYKEEGAQELLEKSHIKLFDTLKELLLNCDLIFIAIQTPHEKEYEGITRLPAVRKDFNYEYLIKAVDDLNEAEKSISETPPRIFPPLVLISTVLPGTIDREILTRLSTRFSFCYNPFFIAMGTTIKDFLFPEFVLFGTNNALVVLNVKAFYSTITSAPFYQTSIVNAELIKVSYNTYITQKIVFSNNLMEICEKVGGNVDEVTSALGLATRRLISTAYMKGGMGDGGNCHPRDNIALSWFAKDIGLSCDIYENMMLAREDQTDFLAYYIFNQYNQYFGYLSDSPIIILGKTFKPETNLTGGSPSILLYNILVEKFDNMLYDSKKIKIMDPYVDCSFYEEYDREVALYFIGTNHEIFQTLTLPETSLVIDPWGDRKFGAGVTVRKIGRH
jgi:UDPglucose 6-dehydrogenase